MQKGPDIRKEQMRNGILEVSRRRQRGSVDDLLPDDLVPWARDVWRDRLEIAKLASGPWMLRAAADALGIDQEEVHKLLKRSS